MKRMKIYICDVYSIKKLESAKFKTIHLKINSFRAHIHSKTRDKAYYNKIYDVFIPIPKMDRSLSPHYHYESTYKCRLVCSNLKTNWRTDVCAGVAKIKAQHGVYKACNNGKLKGFEHACMPTCRGEKYRGRNSASGNSFEECKSEWK